MGGSYVGTSIYSTQLTQLQYCRTYCELLIGVPDTVQCILELVMLVHSRTMLYFTVQCYTLELYTCTVDQMPHIILYMYISYMYSLTPDAYFISTSIVYRSQYCALYITYPGYCMYITVGISYTQLVNKLSHAPVTRFL